MADKRIRDELSDTSMNDSTTSSTHSPPPKQRNVAPSTDVFEDAPVSCDPNLSIPKVSSVTDTNNTMGEVSLLGVFEEIKKLNVKVSSIKAEIFEVLSDKVGKLVKEMFDTLAQEIKEDVKQTVVQSIKTEILNETKADVKSELKATDEVLRKMKKQVDEQEQSLLKIQADTRKREEDWKKGVGKIEQVNEMVHDKMMFLESKVLDQEARSRRKNLVFFGLKEEDNEDQHACKKKIYELAREKCKVDKEIIIERAHRLGTERQDSKSKPRPIIACFVDYNDKMLVKEGRKHFDKVKDKDLGIADDLPGPIRDAQKLLLPELKQAKLETKEAFIRFPAKLVINGKVVRSINPLDLDASDRQNTEPPSNRRAAGQQDRNAWQVQGPRGRGSRGRGGNRGGR